MIRTGYKIAVFLCFLGASVCWADDDLVMLDVLNHMKEPGACKEQRANVEVRKAYGPQHFLIGMNEDLAVKTRQYAKSTFDLYLSSRNGSDLSKAERLIREAKDLEQTAVTKRFQIADAALAAGCLDIADEGYRKILSTYTQPSDQATRDRAKVGIDDVRAKRAIR